jgi:acetyl esterase
MTDETADWTAAETAAEPLYNLIRKTRQPAALRELMAACLRSIYMSDPFTSEEDVLPQPPKILFEEVSVSEITTSGIRCVIYSPKKRIQKLPLMLYMHGGGFVIGCSEDTDYITRMLCHSNQVVVVSVNYRLAPETVFPGALSDCELALDAAIGQSSALGIDPTSVYLAGDSAGANLAAALYYRLQQQQQQRRQQESIKGLILLAPWLDMEVEAYDSYNRLAPTGIVFDAAFLGYARAAYVGFEQWKNPLVSPLFSSLKDMPPTIALIGTEDPFIDQVLKLKHKALDSDCKQIEIEIYPGMPHCFYSFPDLFVEEQDCYQRISAFIRRTSHR